MAGNQLQVSVAWKNNAVLAGNALECIITFSNDEKPCRTSTHNATVGRTQERHNRVIGRVPISRDCSDLNAGRFSRDPRTDVERRLPHPIRDAPSFDLSYSDKSETRTKAGESKNLCYKSNNRRSPQPPLLVSNRNGYAFEAEKASCDLDRGVRRIHSRAYSLHVLPLHKQSQPEENSLANPRYCRPSIDVSSTPNAHFSRGGASAILKRNDIEPTPSIEHIPKDHVSVGNAPNILHTGQPEFLKAPSRGAPGNIQNSSRKDSHDSGDAYTFSNGSTDTLHSDIVVQQASLSSAAYPMLQQQQDTSSPITSDRAIMIMGYAHIHGSFQVDGSLINRAHFEDVKRKGIIGGHGGGGLVRSMSKKRESGLLHGSVWGNLGNAFAGVLGSSGISSMEGAHTSGSDKAIPILSTPQSVLFVNLCLAPRERRSFTFSQHLPKKIPPSYSGKTIVVSYKLVIGVQCPASEGQTTDIQTIELPFRILPCVLPSGDTLVHDLMNPYTFLSDNAVVNQIGASQDAGRQTTTMADESIEDELSLYLTRVLSTDCHSDDSKSPFISVPKRLLHEECDREDSESWTGAIDCTVARAPKVLESRNISRFEIKQGNDKVATIRLGRTYYRLGETIPVVVDLQRSTLPCYSIHLFLETCEDIDPRIALRSAASLQRVTRCVFASSSECCISNGRILFFPMLPMTATANFATTGIKLEWKIRVQFVTSTSKTQNRQGRLLHRSMRDERGIIECAEQQMSCETLDVTVPIRVVRGDGCLDEISSASSDT